MSTCVSLQVGSKECDRLRGGEGGPAVDSAVFRGGAGGGGGGSPSLGSRKNIERCCIIGK